MADITKNIHYIEGQWDAKSMLKNIHRTTYQTLEGAVLAKQELIKNFEEKFGYSRDMDEFDPKYALNVGILDSLLKSYEDGKENEEEE